MMLEAFIKKAALQKTNLQELSVPRFGQSLQIASAAEGSLLDANLNAPKVRNHAFPEMYSAF